MLRLLRRLPPNDHRLSSVADLLYYVAMEDQPAANSNIGLWRGLRELFQQLSGKRRREFVQLIGLMVVGALVELATVGSVIPFLALLSRQDSATRLSLPAQLLGSIGPGFGSGGVVATAVVFASLAITAGLIRIELAWLTQRFAYKIGHDLALGMQRRILSQSYSFHISRHSSTLITVTDKVEVLVFDVILPLIQTMIAVFIGGFLLIGLLYINAIATLTATVAFLAIYAAVSAITAGHRARNSGVVATGYHERLKIAQESLGGIRDVIIDKSQTMHLALFDQVNSRLARARATTNFIAQAPRFIVESAGMIIIVVIAALLSARAGGLVAALPFLGALAVGAQRLLPLAQTVYNGWSLAAAHRSIVGQVVELSRLPLPLDRDGSGSLLPLKERIRFDRVTFSYPSRPRAPAVDNVSLDIVRGSMFAFVGHTGSGKTTLADLLMGLLEPTEGQILIDQVALNPSNAARWQRAIAHVPQSIFLADATIAQNIALSLPDEEPRSDRVVEAAKRAQLYEFVVSLPDGFETHVGERGIRLSGGQRQRLGIARAIYKNTPILVFDEATSALDEPTEAAVMTALDELRREGRTVIIIAHRLSTISRSDLVARFDRGRLVELGSFADVFGATAKLS